MALKYEVASLDVVPEAQRSLYVQKDGKFVLDVEGVAPAAALAEANSRLAEFRDNNRGLKGQVDELTVKLKAVEGIDPAEHATLKAKVADLEKKAPAKDTELQAIKAQLESLGKALTETAEREKSTKAELQRKELESTLTQAGIKAGVEERALPDYLARGLSVFKIEDGKLVAKRGDAPLFSKVRPTEPLPVDEWLTELATEAAHLFKPSKGGNAGQSSAGAGGGGQVRTIPSGARLTADDLKDLASGKAVREEAA